MVRPVGAIHEQAIPIGLGFDRVSSGCALCFQLGDLLIRRLSQPRLAFHLRTTLCSEEQRAVPGSGIYHLSLQSFFGLSHMAGCCCLSSSQLYPGGENSSQGFGHADESTLAMQYDKLVFVLQLFEVVNESSRSQH